MITKSSLYSRYYAEACNEWRVHLLGLASALPSQRWRAVGDIVFDLTSPGFELQTFRADSDVFLFFSSHIFFLFLVLSYKMFRVNDSGKTFCFTKLYNVSVGQRCFVFTTSWASSTYLCHNIYEITLLLKLNFDLLTFSRRESLCQIFSSLISSVSVFWFLRWSSKRERVHWSLVLSEHYWVVGGCKLRNVSSKPHCFATNWAECTGLVNMTDFWKLK